MKKSKQGSTWVRRCPDPEVLLLESILGYWVTVGDNLTKTRKGIMGVIQASFLYLTPVERKLLCLRYGLGHGYYCSWEELAHIFKVTKGEVIRRESHARRKVQVPAVHDSLVSLLPASVSKRPVTSPFA